MARASQPPLPARCHPTHRALPCPSAPPGHLRGFAEGASPGSGVAATAARLRPDSGYTRRRARCKPQRERKRRSPDGSTGCTRPRNPRCPRRRLMSPRTGGRSWPRSRRSCTGGTRISSGCRSRSRRREVHGSRPRPRSASSGVTGTRWASASARCGRRPQNRGAKVGNRYKRRGTGSSDERQSSRQDSSEEERVSVSVSALFGCVLTNLLELPMCTYHTTHFCGVCGACQREQLARWRKQLAAATALARSKESARGSTPTSHMYSAPVAPVRVRSSGEPRTTRQPWRSVWPVPLPREPSLAHARGPPGDARAWWVRLPRSPLPKTSSPSSRGRESERLEADRCGRRCRRRR